MTTKTEITFDPMHPLPGVVPESKWPAQLDPRFGSAPIVEQTAEVIRHDFERWMTSKNGYSCAIPVRVELDVSTWTAQAWDLSDATPRPINVPLDLLLATVQAGGGQVIQAYTEHWNAAGGLAGQQARQNAASTYPEGY